MPPPESRESPGPIEGSAESRERSQIPRFRNPAPDPEDKKRGQRADEEDRPPPETRKDKRRHRGGECIAYAQEL